MESKNIHDSPFNVALVDSLAEVKGLVVDHLAQLPLVSEQWRNYKYIYIYIYIYIYMHLSMYLSK